MTRNLLVVQPYLAEYRIPFYREVVSALGRIDVSLTIAAGAPDGAQAARGDVGQFPGMVPTSSHSMRMGGPTLRWQRSWKMFSDFDGIVVEASGALLDSYVALLQKHASVGLWGHIASFTGRRSRLDQALERWQLRRADVVLAYTEAGGAEALRAGVESSRIKILHNTVETDGLIARIESMSQDEACRVLGLENSGGLYLGYIGGIDESKRIRMLVAALDKLFDVRPDVRVLVGGKGALEHLFGPAVARGQVLLLGRVETEEKAAMARVASVLLNPGRVGLLAVESLAMGLPIVTTDWPFHAPEFEYLTPGVDCVVSANDLDSFASTVIGIVDDEDRRERLRKSAAAKAGEPSLSGMVDAFVEGVATMFS